MMTDDDFLAGGGELGTLMRAKDWSATPLGPAAGWPQSLRTAVSILLNSRYPMFILWGPRLIKIYNDGYRPILGDKHPWALGRPGTEVWPEIWNEIGPMVDRVVRHGEATWSEDLRLFMHRRGFPEEVFFTFSYSPIRDESGGIGGMFCACTETTAKVLGERRLELLRDLAAAPAQARSVEDACRLSMEVLRSDPEDIPFARIDLVNGAGWPPGLHRIADLEDGSVKRPRGPWPEPPHSVMVLPVLERSPGRSGGILVLAVSARLPFDEAYRGFFELVAGQVAASIANAKASEEERLRAEALAELDRAKTTFFSNVSHEFRTPLTLLLGPVEDALADAAEPLGPVQRERLDLVRRGGMRLQKLVNALLDFSRIEAGRAEARLEPTDVSALTTDLASGFRSAVERAGLALVVDCPPLPEPAWVDPGMWEKVVLNLLSNALKFTFEGGITVTVRPRGDRFELAVRDTGTGIAAAELPRVFERFRRVEGARSRTHEGTGIGLALVHELVKLHGGTVRVESVEGEGSTFIVSVPYRKAGLETTLAPAAPGSSAAAGSAAEPYVEEALRWLPDGVVPGAAPPRPALPAAAGRRRERILWADDNSDMRDYVRRLLAGRYDVETVADGEEALAAVRARRPDLVLADVMMPRLDGIQLVHALRAEPETRSLPVILLSARAGEEARIEGLEAGATDYLFKPFTARELLAQVASKLELGGLQSRLESERTALADLFAQTPVPTAVLRGPTLVFEMANRAYLEVAGNRDLVGKPLLEAMPEMAGQGFDDLLRDVLASGEPRVGNEARLRLERDGRLVDTYWTFLYAPLRGAGGAVDRVIAISNDVTAQVLAREAIRSSEERYRSIFESAAVAIWEDDFSAVQAALAALADSGVRDFRSHFAAHPGLVRELIDLVRVTDVNEAALRMFAAADKRELMGSLDRVFLPDTAPVLLEVLLAVAEGRTLLEADATVSTLQGEPIDVLVGMRFPPRGGSFERVLVTLVDITSRKRAEQELQDADRRKDEFIATLSHELRNPLAPIRNALHFLRSAAEPDPTIRSVHEMMERQVNHLVRLVDDLLESSRISRGKLELRMERVTAETVVRNAIETSQPLIDQAGHRLEVALPQEPVWLWGDPVRLAQIVSNLLNNAAKYTPRGGRIEVEVATRDSRVAIVVRDDGAGISKEAMARVFDMFTRGDDHGGRAKDGLGIGLALSRRLAGMHGGTIEARSEGAGRGAEFTVLLPLAPDAAAAPARVGDDAHASPLESPLASANSRDATGS